MLIVETLGELAAFAIGAFASGSLLLRATRRLTRGEAEPPSLVGAAARLLAGLGGTAYVSLLFGPLGGLRWWTLLLAGLVAVLVARDDVLSYARAVRRPGGDRVTLALGGLAVAMAGGEFLAALAPPEASDELAYHLPIAHAISSDGLHQVLHGSVHRVVEQTDVYGNLPILAEALYSAGLAVAGTALVHALHLLVLLAAVALVAGVVRELWGARTAALAAAGLLAYPDLTYNATTAYVDAATASFELGALVLVLRWLVRGNGATLGAAALMLGFGLSIKYTAFFTALVVGGLVAVTLVRRRELRLLVVLAGIVVVTCSFWYAKNAIRFGNPVWPFYFGHRSLDEGDYTSFVASVHAFGPRTLTDFLEVPWRLDSVTSIVPFLGLYLSVLAIAVGTARRAAVVLVAYVALFVTYWFWLASHQQRFLLTGAAAAIVAAAVAIGAGGRRTHVALLVVALLAVGVVEAKRRSYSQDAAVHFVPRLLGSPKSRYALGLESRAAYLARYYGCEYDAVAYLERNRARTPTLMHQLALLPYFAPAGMLGKLPTSARTPAAARAALRDGGFRSVLVLATEPGNLAATGAASAPLERLLRPIWSEGDCTISRIVDSRR